MNAQSLYKLLLVGCCCYCLMACGEDNGPLSLINTEGNETLIDITGNTLQLSPFSKGESFYIDGGDGAYTIDNNNDEVIIPSFIENLMMDVYSHFVLWHKEALSLQYKTMITISTNCR